MADANASTQYMLTTVDNPFSPFTQFKEWYSYDVAKGYNTAALLARLAIVSPILPENDADRTIQLTIEEIIKENVSGMHRRVLVTDYL